MKDNNPNLKIAVGGCVASQEGEAISKRAPAVDIVFGPQTLHKLPDLYEESSQDGKRKLDISFPKIEKFDHFPEPKAEGPSAFVSVMEGCNKYCSFCVVPHTRGHEVSRPFDDILQEVKSLADQGVREINFLGQNVNNFKGEKDGEKSSLAELIRDAAQINNIDRLRFTTSHPFEFKDDLVELYLDVPELVSHVHLPVQSGSDRILKLMRRRYTRESYLDLVNRIRVNRPDISFSSDFIVGFPGETEEDFQDTLDVIDSVKFDESFSFIYSPRPNTPAAKMEDDVSLDEKKERLSILQNKLNNYSSQISRKMVGTIEKCLVTDISKRNPGEFQARTENNRVVNFSSAKNMIGSFIDLEIVEAKPNSLRGNFTGGTIN